MLRKNNIFQKDDEICSRSLATSKAKGIVALMVADKPIVCSIKEIAMGGVSFLHSEFMHLPTNEIRMDILIFDIQTDTEYFLDQVKGRIKSCEADPKSTLPILHFGVEFLELEPLQRNVLQAYLDGVRP